MSRFNSLSMLALTLMFSVGVGCHLRQQHVKKEPGCLQFGPVAIDIEYADVSACTQCSFIDSSEIDPPLSVIHPQEGGEMTAEFWDLHLDYAITLALQNNEVMKDLGGRVLTNPEAVRTAYDPAIRESDPLFGPEGALSAFDTQLSTNLFWQNNDRVFNNSIAGRGVNQFQQDLASLDLELSKLSGTGSRYSLRHRTEYDANNSPLSEQIFPSSWQSWIEASVRQPLLQGAGATFNRIAGPNAQPGFNFSTGVLIARMNTDISLAEFEAAVIDFVKAVENAYWELQFAYRDLDAAVLARDGALETWQTVNAKYENNLPGGETFKEARARAQYFQFQDRVQNALSGTATRGSSVGVYKGERQLRTLLGLPTSDGRLLRPVDSPPEAQVSFDWQAALDEALTQRVELRRQMWTVKRRELELIAAKNFTLPRLDALVTYRLRGFGNDLTGDLSDETRGAATLAEQSAFASAWKDLGSWDHQEWEGGLQLQVPLGMRRAWTGVRHAQLQLARERAILKEQQREVALQLSDAISETSRAYESIRMGFNRLEAAKVDLEATQAAFEADQATVELVLDSQQRLTEAESRYHRSLTDHALALKDVHLRKGSLLAYDGVHLSEGAWPHQAYRDAAELRRRWRQRRTDLYRMKPHVVSAGPVLHANPGHVSGVIESEPGELQLLPPMDPDTDPLTPAPKSVSPRQGLRFPPPVPEKELLRNHFGLSDYPPTQRFQLSAFPPTGRV